MVSDGNQYTGEQTLGAAVGQPAALHRADALGRMSANRRTRPGTGAGRSSAATYRVGGSATAAGAGTNPTGAAGDGARSTASQGIVGAKPAVHIRCTGIAGGNSPTGSR